MAVVPATLADPATDPTAGALANVIPVSVQLELDTPYTETGIDASAAPACSPPKRFSTAELIGAAPPTSNFRYAVRTYPPPLAAFFT